MKATLTDYVLLRVELERERQRKLLEEKKIQFDVASLSEDDGTKLAVLLEEVGEVARVIVEYRDFDRDRSLSHLLINLKHLEEELVQVAAVAVAWAESVQELRVEIGG